MLAHSRDPSHSARVQLYLDDEGNVDIETTKAEAARVDAARMQSATQTRQKVGVRRRRTQAQQGVDPGLMDMLVRQTEALELAEMGGSWVFSNCIDCKIGKCPHAPLSDSLLNVEQPPPPPLPTPIVALTSTVTGTRTHLVRELPQALRVRPQAQLLCCRRPLQQHHRAEPKA